MEKNRNAPPKTVEITPDMICCANCRHSVIQKIQDKPQLMCKFLPPTPVVIQAQSAIMSRNAAPQHTVMHLNPIVTPTDFCSHQEMAQKSQAANDDAPNRHD